MTTSRTEKSLVEGSPNIPCLVILGSHRCPFNLLTCCCYNYHAAPNLRSDSESDFSPSNSEDDDDDAEEHEGKRVDQPKTPSKNTSAAALYKTPSKKSKKAAEVRVSS